MQKLLMCANKKIVAQQFLTKNCAQYLLQTKKNFFKQDAKKPNKQVFLTCFQGVN